MGLWLLWSEIFVHFLACGQRPRQTEALITINIVVAGNYEELLLIQLRGFQQIVKKRSRQLVFFLLAAMGNVSGGKDQVGGAAFLPKFFDRIDQGFKNNIAVVRITTTDMKVRDVQPGNIHASCLSGNPKPVFSGTAILSYTDKRSFCAKDWGIIAQPETCQNVSRQKRQRAALHLLPCAPFLISSTVTFFL